MWVGTMKPASRAFTCSLELVRRDLGPRAQDDDGAHLLAEGGMGHADDGAVGDGGVFEEGGLDLHRVDVLAAPDDHVLGPVDDVDEVVLVEPRHVAGVQPAPGERLGRLLGRFQ